MEPRGSASPERDEEPLMTAPDRAGWMSLETRADWERVRDQARH